MRLWIRMAAGRSLPAVAALLFLVMSPVEKVPFLPILQAFGDTLFNGRHVSLSIPDSLEPVQSLEDYVEVALRDRNTGFPTFNIIVLPPERRAPESVSEYADRTVESYRKTGLLDASLTGGGSWTVAGQSTFFAEMSFKRNGEALRSLVTAVFLPERDLIMTFIDREDSFASHIELRTRLFDSVLLPQNPPPEAYSGDRRAPSGRRTLMVTVILLAAVFSTAACFVWKRRSV